MPDWKTFIIDASWVSGIENVREYWMNAWTSPTRDRAAGDPQAADDGDDHVLHVAHEHRDRLHQARHELRAEGRLVELVVGRRGTAASTSRWRPNAFTIAWPVKVSSICALSAPVFLHWAMNRGRAVGRDDLHQRTPTPARS